MVNRSKAQQWAILLTAFLSLLSCSDKDAIENGGSPESAKTYTLDVTVSQGWQAESSSSTRASVVSNTIREANAFPLVLNETEVSGINGSMPAKEKVSVPAANQTRASLVNAENFYDNFMIWKSAETYLKADRKETGSNSYAVEDENEALSAGGTFYGIAPYLSLGGQLKATSTPSVVSSSMSGDVRTKTDILAASCAMAQGSMSGNFNFSHIYSAIDFKVGSMSFAKDVTISKITISNVYVSGDYDIGSKTWTIDQSKGNEIVSDLNFKVQNNDQENKLITNSENGTTFLLIPQTTPNDAVISIVINYDGNDKTLTFPFGGKTLKQGYTKTLGLGSSNNTYGGYYLAVSDPPCPYPYADDQTQPFTVTSYRLDGSKTPVGWTVEGYSTDNGETWSTKLPEAMSLSAYSGTGGQQANEVPTTLGKSTAKEKETMTAQLRAARPVSNYDLSLHDVAGATIKPSSANCYIVRAGGTYRLPMVYGNTLKDGVKNIHSSNAYIDWKRREITSTNWQITEATGAELMWCDGDASMFSNVHIEQQAGATGDEVKNYLVFTVDPSKIASCNAVLAATAPDPDASTSTAAVWSWHIWITTMDLTETVTAYEDGGKGLTYNLSQVLLGAKASDENIGGREILVKIRQKESNRTATVRLKQLGLMRAFDGTYYQWGRKDPFPRKLGEGNYQEAGYHSYWTAIKYPNYFYTNRGNWTSNVHLDLWSVGKRGSGKWETSVKTVYDPCPVGFKVPPARAFDFINQTPVTSLESGMGYYFYTSLNSSLHDMNHLIFIPKAGQRDGNAGDVSNYGASAVGWTADNQSLTNAGGQAWGYLAYDGTYECVQNFMARGSCILPMKDE